jgi:thiol-disulfide isomerase/thioredoxin
MFKKFFLIALVITALQAKSQNQYKIEFKIKGWKDTTVYLGHYYGESTLVRDTAVVKNEQFVFDGKDKLAQGVYFLVLDKTKLFDFVVGQNTFFSMETNAADYVNEMVVKGDEDNKLFFENLKYIGERSKEVEPFIKVLQDSTLKEDKKKSARDAFSKVNEKVVAFQNNMVAKHATTLTARLIKATQQIDVPAPPKKANGTIDSTFQLRYYRQHFFDNFDLADDALIRMPRPFYNEKTKEYLEKLFVPAPDTITKEINRLAAIAKKNPETYKYFVYNCMVMYQQPEIMGLDEVFVNIYDKYFASGEMDFWVTAPVKKNLKDHADKIRSSMIGRAGANLIMQDQNLQPRSMYDIKNKYTILYIFDPDCGHCREETPKLVDFYLKNKLKYNFEVYAVAADSSLTKMKNFIKEFKTPWITVNGPRSYTKEHYSKLYHSDTTPTIYILDDKKKIIAKKLPVKQLDDFLGKHEKFEKAKNAKGKAPSR